MRVLLAVDGSDCAKAATRGLGTIGGLLLGSVSLGVTRDARCPVLVVKGEPGAVRNVVVGIDGSDEALAAVRLVAWLALPSDATVHLVGAVEIPVLAVTSPDMIDGALGSSIAALTQEMRRTLDEAIARATEALRGTKAKVESAVIDGRPARVLVDRCAAVSADLLVVGARGLGGFQRLLLGSVSETALREAPCSVLVVRE
jgi:nucleotide-binding universal stress UspA family protein